MTEISRRALIVTLGRARGSLAAARGLHHAGWSVGIGTPDGKGMVTASRACARSHVVARPRGDGDEFVSDVRRASPRAAMRWSSAAGTIGWRRSPRTAR